MDTAIPEPGPDGLVWKLDFPSRDGGAGWQWRHYDLVNRQARNAIEADAALPEFARAILVGSDDSVRVVSDDDVVAGVVPSYARSGDADAFEITFWHFAMTPRILVTGRKTATRTLVAMWDAIQRGRAPASPTAAINMGITEFAREARVRLAQLSDYLDPVEDQLIEWHGDVVVSELSGRIGAARREASRLKRVAVPLMRALEEDAEELPSWTHVDRTDTGQRLLGSNLDDIAALADRAHSLQDEVDTRLGEETNRRLYLVSVITTLVLPATFVTGYFGMNTGGLPWGGDGAPNGSVYATILCAAAIILTLLGLRWKRLL